MHKPRFLNRSIPITLAVLALAAVVVAGYRLNWWTGVPEWIQTTVRSASGAQGVKSRAEDHHDDAESHDHAHDDHMHDDHAHHDHDHPHDNANSLTLSPQARLNLGLTPDQVRPVSLRDYVRSITVPAIVSEQPGRMHVEISAPLTGVVTAVHASPGEALEAGSLLFEMRLTHEDLVQAQIEFLKTLAEHDVELQEIERLRPLVERGAIAATVTREREYAAARLSALLSAQREALRLHGLSEEQVDQIAQERRLLRAIQVIVPTTSPDRPDQLRLTRGKAQPVALIDQESQESAESDPLVVQELRVHKGQALTAGETMCVLADYSVLYIEGAAFEQDGPALTRAAEQGWKVEALLHEPGGETTVIPGLEIVYLANEVDVESRILHFYVRLENELLDRGNSAGGHRYVNWRFRPGQRLQLRVPIEVWKQQYVLPVDAVTRDGAEQYVFVDNGDHFDRVPVQVLYRDQTSVVIARGGALKARHRVALRGAHQMQLALKNKSGAGIDPHAGHGHTH